MEPKDGPTPAVGRAQHRAFVLEPVVDDLLAELVELLDANKTAAPEPPRSDGHRPRPDHPWRRDRDRRTRHPPHPAPRTRRPVYPAPFP